MIKHHYVSQCRFDRVLLKSSKWKVIEIEIIGKEGILLEDLVKIFPSDHFGLKTTLVWNQEIKQTFEGIHHFHDLTFKFEDYLFK